VHNHSALATVELGDPKICRGVSDGVSDLRLTPSKRAFYITWMIIFQIDGTVPCTAHQHSMFPIFA